MLAPGPRALRRHPLIVQITCEQLILAQRGALAADHFMTSSQSDKSARQNRNRSRPAMTTASSLSGRSVPPLGARSGRLLTAVRTVRTGLLARLVHLPASRDQQPGGHPLHELVPACLRSPGCQRSENSWPVSDRA